MPPCADRNLLFGILAVQLNFVSPGALVAAMQAWLLDKARPEVVFACYGMNDGIYLPLDRDRFAAFQKGVTHLIDQCKEAGVRQVFLITPPIYDFTPKAGEFDMMMLLTGVGTRQLSRVLGDRFTEGLRRVAIAARGPKPVAALRELGLTPAVVAPEGQRPADDEHDEHNSHRELHEEHYNERSHAEQGAMPRPEPEEPGGNRAGQPWLVCR